MIRKDSWNEQDDMMLAETVLRNIRSGYTQSRAFEEASKQLKRTEQACSVRWNNVLKKQYQKAYELAKKTRAMKRETPSLVTETTEKEFTHPMMETMKKYAKEYDSMKKELSLLKQRVKELEEENQQLKEQGIEINEEYQTMMKILTKAQQMIS